MFGRETRMLLQALPRARDEQERAGAPVGRQPRHDSSLDSRRRSRSRSRCGGGAVRAAAAGADQARCLQADHRGAPRRVSGAVGRAAARRDPRRRVRGRLLAAESVRAAGAAAAAAGAGHPLRDAGRPTGASGLRAISVCRGACATPCSWCSATRGCCGAASIRARTCATLIDGLEEAFGSFGGVPQELLFDQMKAVITRDLRLEGGALVRNAEFLRFAHHWGFTPRACRPYRAQTKGKVERPVRYLRGNFVYGRTFLHDADLDHQRQRWLERVANVRVHGTTRERPRDRFDREERFLLQPLRAAPLHLAGPRATVAVDAGRVGRRGRS